MRTAGADERFAVSRRGPYWQPGDSVIAEPWVAVAETSTGHVVTRCGRNYAHAVELVEHWEALHHAGLLFDAARDVVGAAVVDPHGAVVQSWGSVPVPGGPPRWSALLRLMVEQDCRECGAPRWPGCWVGLHVQGCGECLPARELDDPRPWPAEPSRSGGAVVERKRTTPVRRRTVAKAAAAPVPDGQGDLLSHRLAVG